MGASPPAGRDAELARVRAAVAVAHARRGAGAIVLGERGIGKSAVLAAVADGLPGCVLRAGGRPGESDVPFAGLYELIRPVAGLRVRLDDARRAPLDRVLGLAEADPGPLATGAAVLDLLAEAGRDEPVTLLLDDVHLFDADTQQTLAFVVPRIAPEAVAVLAAARTGRPHPLLEAGLEEVRLDGLSREACAELLAPRHPAADVVERLWRETRGIPAALLSAATRLSDDELRGLVPLTGPTPATTVVRRLVTSEVATLPDEVRRALVVVAASDGDEIATVRSAVEAIGVEPDALVVAEALGLIRVEDGIAVFASPVLRSTLYHDAPPAEQRRAHDALAQFGGGDQRAVHLAAAATAPSEHVAAELEAAAVRTVHRDGMLGRAGLLARAATMSPAAADRCRRRIAAANAYRRGGRLVEAQLLLDGLDLATADADTQAEAVVERALIVAAGGGDGDAARAMGRAGEAASDGAGAWARARAGLVCLAAWRQAAAAEVGGSASAAVLLEAGPDATEEWRAAGALEEATRGDLGGRDAAARVADGARAIGDVWALGEALTTVAWSEIWVGRLPAAAAAAREASELGEKHGLARLARLAAGPAAVAAAGRGRAADAATMTTTLREYAIEHDAPEARAFAAWADGLVTLAEGDAVGAAVAFDEAVRFLRDLGVDDLRFALAAADAVEACIAAGRRGEAEAIAAAVAAESPAAAHLRARIEALLAPDQVTALVAALAIEPCPQPVRARTRALLGRALLRTGDVAGARPMLRDAAHELAAAGWEALAAGVRSDLRRCDEEARRQSPRVADLLTAQELQIARVVAEGASNREIAERLFLSPKTVEFHLRNAFRKLGVRSRSELAARITAESLAGSG